MRFVARRRALEEFAGRYESYRRIKGVIVGRDGETLRLSFEDPLGGDETPLVVVDPVAGEFERALASSARRPVTFERTASGVECHTDRCGLHRIDPLDGSG